MPHHRINELLSTNIRGVVPDAPVSDVLKLMRDEKISCVPVFLSGTPVGILTERDILRAADRILAGRKLEVRDLMSQSVLTIEQHRTPGDALAIMRNNKIRHLIVSDDGFHVVGMLTLTDLLKKNSDDCFFGVSTVSNVMAKTVYTVERGTSVMRVLHEMAAHDFSCVVIQKNNEPLGIITERDLVWLVTEKPELWSTRVENIMSIPVTTIATTASPREAVELMVREEFRHLVVLDQDNKIAGLLTQSLLCRELNCPVSAPICKPV